MLLKRPHLAQYISKGKVQVLPVSHGKDGLENLSIESRHRELKAQWGLEPFFKSRAYILQSLHVICSGLFLN